MLAATRTAGINGRELFVQALLELLPQTLETHLRSVLLEVEADDGRPTCHAEAPGYMHDDRQPHRLTLKERLAQGRLCLVREGVLPLRRHAG